MAAKKPANMSTPASTVFFSNPRRWQRAVVNVTMSTTKVNASGMSSASAYPVMANASMSRSGVLPTAAMMCSAMRRESPVFSMSLPMIIPASIIHGTVVSHGVNTTLADAVPQRI